MSSAREHIVYLCAVMEYTSRAILGNDGNIHAMTFGIDFMLGGGVKGEAVVE
jgi:hypothetical protein